VANVETGILNSLTATLKRRRDNAKGKRAGSITKKGEIFVD